MGVAVYAGILSDIGVLLLCATGAICLFTAAVRRPDARARLVVQEAGAVSTLLALDDLFRLHESVVPRLLGVPEHALYPAYGLLGFWLVLRFRPMLLRADGRLLLLALACFAASVALGLAALPVDALALEDGLKFVGIACWFVYFVRFAGRSLAPRRRAAAL